MELIHTSTYGEYKPASEPGGSFNILEYLNVIVSVSVWAVCVCIGVVARNAYLARRQREIERGNQIGGTVVVNQPHPNLNATGGNNLVPVMKDGFVVHVPAAQAQQMQTGLLNKRGTTKLGLLNNHKWDTTNNLK